MPNTPVLYLTKAERAVFEKLPEAVRGGVKVEEETLAFTDTEEKMAVRMKSMKISHPGLKKLQDESQKKKLSAEEVAKLSETMDLSGLSKEDLTELAFAWGPTVFSLMISMALQGVNTPDDAFALSQLSYIRHGLLRSFNQ